MAAIRLKSFPARAIRLGDVWEVYKGVRWETVCVEGVLEGLCDDETLPVLLIYGGEHIPAFKI